MKKMMIYISLVFVLLTCPFGAFAAKQENGQIDAKAYLLMDESTGKVLLSKNEHEKLYPASVTKIMPILLVVEALDSGKISLDDKVTVSADAASKGGSQIWLKEGEQMTVDELLRAAVISSANDACTALGEYIAGSEEGIVKMMNERAKELKMNDTNFENCTGLDDETDSHLTSAYDIALMSRQLLSHERIQTYSTVWMDSLRGGKTQLVNTNKLVRFYKGTTGLKTGTTSKAGHCISASAQRDGLSLIAVVLGSSSGANRFESAKKLLNYGFANYETVTPEFDRSLLTDVKVIKGIKAKFTPEVEKINPVTVNVSDKNKIESKIELCAEVEAPVEEGQLLGKITFTCKNEQIATYKIYAPEQIRRLTLIDVMKCLLRSISSKSCQY